MQILIEVPLGLQLASTCRRNSLPTTKRTTNIFDIPVEAVINPLFLDAYLQSGEIKSFNC